MERLRLDLIRRARAERDGQAGHLADDPSSHSGHELDLESNRSRPMQAPTRFFGLPNFLGRRAPHPTEATQESSEAETPKSPEFGPRRPFGLAGFGQILSSGQPTGGQDPRPPPPTRPRQADRTNIPRLDSPDPAELHLAQLAEDGRRRRRNRQNGREQPEPQDEGSRHKKPMRFLGCLPWVPSRRIRSLILRCLVSGLFFGILLAVYIGLSASNTLNTGEQIIMLMLIILLATAFFCYSLLRLCLIVVRGGRAAPNRGMQSRHHGSSGYAIPSQPIRVVLARDEEVAGTDTQAQKSTPPAYGMWRQSVRVDPNRLFWQRNDPANMVPRLPEGIVGPRPPSYASDDGVSYVMDAAPRSTAPPMTETPMPLHPSEVGRIAHRPG